MARARQVPLFDRLPAALEVVGGDRRYHLRPKGAIRLLCGRMPMNPLKSRRKRAGWGGVPVELRCSQCARRLETLRRENGK